MVVAKASLKFKKLNASDKVSYGTYVVTKLNAALALPKNPFPDLPFTPGDLQSVTNTLSVARSDMENGGKAASAAIKAAIKAWDAPFTDVANYVTMVAQASEDVEGTIILAGLDPTKTTKSKKPLPDAIKGFSAVTNHKAAAITIGATNVSEFATGYMYAAMPAGVSLSFNGNVTILTVGDKEIYISVDTKKEIDMAMLPEGTPYNVTMLAFNAAGCGVAAIPQQVIPRGNA